MRPFEAIFQQGLYARAVSARSRRERADTARIRPEASYAVRNDPRNGISALPQETYHDCYTSRV